jgi:hypothetical protein
MKMRRKPEFDRFTAGLSQRVSLWINDEDATHQDLVNLTRSELSRIWIYLIEKLNKSEQEIQKLKADREVMFETLKFYAEMGHWGGPIIQGISGAIDPSDWYWCELGDMRGGKRANQALKSIGELND